VKLNAFHELLFVVTFRRIPAGENDHCSLNLISDFCFFTHLFQLKIKHFKVEKWNFNIFQLESVDKNFAAQVLA
jgi:hypothetical protein